MIGARESEIMAISTDIRTFNVMATMRSDIWERAAMLSHFFTPCACAGGELLNRSVKWALEWITWRME